MISHLSKYVTRSRSLFTVIKLGLITAAGLSLTACNGLMEGMLAPKGFVAFEERKLFFDTLALMLIVVLPVIIMSITFVYHYRVSHRIRDYKPNWDHNHFLESLWWGIPCVIIVILAVLTWKKTYELDPYAKIKGYNEPPLLIQVIAMPYKWVFIYPEQNIATVNYLEIPVGRQVEYWTTADNTAMCAFFIPQIGSQIYSMAGMRTKLFLVADEPGQYLGMNTLFNGDGFAGMQFPVHAVPREEMDKWFAQVKKSAKPLTDDAYKALTAPSENNPPQFFAGVTPNLFQNVVNSYMNSTGLLHPRDNRKE